MVKQSISLFFLFQFTLLNSQEFDCTVQVITNTNTTSISPKVFKNLEKSISDFINLRRWTDDNFATHQKIKCYMTVNIIDASSENSFKADITIQSERPVFNSTYTSQLLRHNDKAVAFEYIENQPLDFSENAFFSNLTSCLAFYANWMLAAHMDSYGYKGGQTYLDKCQYICNAVPPNTVVARETVTGWQPNEAQDIKGQQLRIGIIMGLLNNGNEKVRLASYKYHIQGIDLMEFDPAKAIIGIESAIKDIYETNGRLYIHKHFILAKIDELTHIYSKQPKDKKKQMGDMLIAIEPIVGEKVGKW